MAGLYLHIPFCRKACHYCDFHFSTSGKLRNEVLNAIVQEMELHADATNLRHFDTLYFGGGTPSLLTYPELQLLFEAIYKKFSISDNAEITLEANPADLSLEYLHQLKLTPINRLSIGLQSFDQAILQWMNRDHEAAHSIQAVTDAANMGFHSLNVDLIYGIPDTSVKYWENQLSQLSKLLVNHLSAYCLTVEPGTALAHFVKKGSSQPVDETLAATHFQMLNDWAKSRSWEHYEMSNYCKPGHRAIHNSNYWKLQPYLGLGPSAHSFTGKARHANVASNPKYVKMLQAQEPSWEIELLSTIDQYHDWLLTGLRTSDGLQWRYMPAMEGDLKKHFEVESQLLIASGALTANNEGLKLPEEHWFTMDQVLEQLFFVEE